MEKLLSTNNKPQLSIWEADCIPLGNGMEVQTVKVKVETLKPAGSAPPELLKEICEALEYALIEAWKDYQKYDATRSKA